MTAATAPAPTGGASSHRPSLWSRLGSLILPVFTGLLLLFLFLPIGVMIVFSFNDPAGRQNITWQGFTLENYLDIWSRPQITGPMVTSLVIATLSTLVATTFGTM